MVFWLVSWWGVFMVWGKFLSDQCARDLAGGWVAPFGSGPKSKGVLQLYCDLFRYAGRLQRNSTSGNQMADKSHGRNTPKGQISFMRYWTPMTPVIYTQTTHSGQPKQQLYPVWRSELSHQASVNNLRQHLLAQPPENQLLQHWRNIYQISITTGNCSELQYLGITMNYIFLSEK